MFQLFYFINSAVDTQGFFLISYYTCGMPLSIDWVKID